MKRKLALFLLALSMSFQTMASNYEDVLKSINKALTEQDFIKAYQIADDNMFEYGGLPEFDVLTGFAAYGSEQYQEAVFAFERVVLERPNSFIGRFYLAQCYRELNNLAAAKKELTFLLSKPLPEEQKSKAANLLNRIERQEINKKRSWHQYVALGMSIDNNVNSGSSLETINIPNLGEIQLFDSAKQVNDISYSINYSGRYQHPITQSQWFIAELGLGHVDFLQYNEYRRNPINLSLTYQQETGLGTLGSSIFTKPLLLQGQDYRVENGLSFSLQKNTSRSTAYNANFSYSVISKDESSELDMARIKGAYAFTLKGSILQTFMLNTYKDINESDLYSFNDKLVVGAMYQVGFPLTEHIISNSYIMYEQHEYDGEHPIFQKTRSESLTALSSQIMFNASNELKLKLFVNFQHKSSNVDLYNYNKAEIGGTWLVEL
jgi:hypothetical protein